MTRVFAKIIRVGCAAFVCAALEPAGAEAGSYAVHACSPDTSPGAWALVNTAPDSYAAGNLCGGPEIGTLDGSNTGSLYANDVLASPLYIPDGARAGWTIAAPPGAMITGISYYRTLGAHASRDVAAGLFTASGQVLEQCRIAIPFGSPLDCSMTNNQAPVAFSDLSTTGLFFGVLCDIVQQAVSACIGGGTIHSVRAYMYSSNVTITESSVPSIAHVGGVLWGGGLIGGTVPVTFSASDNTGIREQAVQSESGQTLISDVHGCDYSRMQPCPQSPGASFAVDTTRVADGPQTFRLVVTDTAGNSAVRGSPPVVVDNYGPQSPLGLTATGRAGSNAIALAWTNPASPPAPVNGAMAQLCSTSCAPAVSVDAFGAAQLTAPGPGVYSVRLWLLDAVGRGGPHNAATTTVTVPASSVPPSPPPSPPGGTGTRIVAVLQGRRLRVSGPIAATGRVTVSWRSKVRGRTVGHGSRVVPVRAGRVRVTFAISRRARTSAATIRVAIRSRRRVVGQARARRA